MEKKIFIAVPSMDSVAAPFAQSLACLDRVGNCTLGWQTGSLIYDARNKLTEQALKAQADYILWLDSDMTFDSDTLKRLMKHMDEGKDIVSGIYFRRAQPYTPVLFSELSPDSEGVKWRGYDDYPQNSTFEVAGIGFGCVLMKADVILDIAARFGNWFAPIGGFGEDLSFCLRASECGYKIYCDSSIKCGHVGHMEVNETLYQALKGAKK